MDPYVSWHTSLRMLWHFVISLALLKLESFNISKPRRLIHNPINFLKLYVVLFDPQSARYFRAPPPSKI